MKILFAALAAAFAATPATATVTVLDFDDISTGRVVAFANYGGLTWGAPSGTFWAVVDPDQECAPNPCGFFDGRTSGSHVATNGFDTTGTISAANPWRAVSLQLGSAWAGLTVQFQGYLDGNLVWDDSFSAVPTDATLITFDSRLIDELRVSPTITGAYSYTLGSGPRMVWDDFAVDLDPVSGIPEPSTWAMMLSGFFMLGASMRRQRRLRQQASQLA